MNLTSQELNNLLIFLSRVDLKGSESIVHATLITKISQALKPPPETPAHETPAA